MSRPAPRPKRTADTWTRTHDQASADSNGHGAKKPRFDYRNPSTLAPDAPEDDAVLELDEIGRAGGTKRNAVNIDGYDSDSDNDNFDARAREKARMEKLGKASGGAGDAEDMFAEEEGDDEEVEEEVVKSGKPKKDVRFLDESEILGQDSASKGGGHVEADFIGFAKGKRTKKEEDSSSDSGDDEDRAQIGSDVDDEIGAGGKKKNAPKLDAFNMRNENEEGKFDESGNFVRKAMDPDAVHDTWLEGVSKKEMKRAREAQEMREQEQKRKDREDDSLVTSDLLATLIRHLEVGENAMEALQRLGRGAPKPRTKPRWQKNKKKEGKTNDQANADEDAMVIDATTTPEDPAETKRKAAVEAITGAADILMTRGDLEIYDHEREILRRMYQRETGEDWVDTEITDTQAAAASGGTNVASGSPSHRQWEYRWTDGRDGGNVNGPYDGAAMKGWSEAGYFGEGVEFRAFGESDDGWTRLADF